MRIGNHRSPGFGPGNAAAASADGDGGGDGDGDDHCTDDSGIYDSEDDDDDRDDRDDRDSTTTTTTTTTAQLPSFEAVRLEIAKLKWLHPLSPNANLFAHAVHHLRKAEYYGEREDDKEALRQRALYHPVLGAVPSDTALVFPDPFMHHVRQSMSDSGQPILLIRDTCEEEGVASICAWDAPLHRLIQRTSPSAFRTAEQAQRASRLFSLARDALPVRQSTAEGGSTEEEEEVGSIRDRLVSMRHRIRRQREAEKVEEEKKKQEEGEDDDDAYSQSRHTVQDLLQVLINVSADIWKGAAAPAEIDTLDIWRCTTPSKEDDDDDVVGDDDDDGADADEEDNKDDDNVDTDSAAVVVEAEYKRVAVMREVAPVLMTHTRFVPKLPTKRDDDACTVALRAVENFLLLLSTEPPQMPLPEEFSVWLRDVAMRTTAAKQQRQTTVAAAHTTTTTTDKASSLRMTSPQEIVSQVADAMVQGTPSGCDPLAYAIQKRHWWAAAQLWENVGDVWVEVADRLVRRHHHHRQQRTKEEEEEKEEAEEDDVSLSSMSSSSVLRDVVVRYLIPMHGIPLILAMAKSHPQELLGTEAGADEIVWALWAAWSHGGNGNGNGNGEWTEHEFQYVLASLALAASPRTVEDGGDGSGGGGGSGMHLVSQNMARLQCLLSRQEEEEEKEAPMMRPHVCIAQICANMMRIALEE